MLLVGAVGVALGVFLVFIGLTRRDAAVPADEYQFDYQAPSERAPQTPREVFRGATAVFERAIAGRQRGNKVAEDLARAVREMNLGITVDDALEHMNQRIASDDFDLMVTAVEIHRVVGGNLAEILDTIAFTIRERIRIKGEIRVLTAQARASGYIITGLPFGVAGILTLISPTYITPLFWPPGLGWVFIAVGLIMMGTGGAIIRRITTIEV